MEISMAAADEAPGASTIASQRSMGVSYMHTGSSMAHLVKVDSEQAVEDGVNDEHEDDAEGAELVDWGYGDAPGVQSQAALHALPSNDGEGKLVEAGWREEACNIPPPASQRL